jgi:hypothetical protein
MTFRTARTRQCDRYDQGRRNHPEQPTELINDRQKHKASDDQK